MNTMSIELTTETIINIYKGYINLDNELVNINNIGDRDREKLRKIIIDNAHELKDILNFMVEEDHDIPEELRHVMYQDYILYPEDWVRVLL